MGKSTLLNALVGEKVSIVSAKPHTTRHRILGVLNNNTDQAVFIDTPGHARRDGRALHRLMSRVIHQSVEDCDLILLVVEATRRGGQDTSLIELLGERVARTIIVLNKVDLVKDKANLLPVLKALGQYPCLSFVPLSAKSGKNLSSLRDEIFKNLPEGAPMFPLNVATDRDMRFRAAEIIREKLLENLHQEIPYGLTVEVEHLHQSEDNRWLAHGLIWLERATHKPIVIGKQGQLLKRVGTAARIEISEMLGDRVHLELWVKIREHWSDSERELQRLGFDAP